MNPYLRLGPSDHGRTVTSGACEAAEREEGYQYEIIDGRIYVSPQPTQYDYTRQHPVVLK